MKEIFPGLWQWRRWNEAKGLHFNGLLIRSGNQWVAIDPPEPEPHDRLEAEAGVPAEAMPTAQEFLLTSAPLEAILLTNKDHVRWSAVLREKTGAEVWIHEKDAEAAGIGIDRAFADESVLPAGLTALHVRGGKTPGETAFLLRAVPGGALILGDALIGRPAGQLSFLPPAKFPAGMDAAREGVRALLEREFDTVLVGDGESILKDGKKAVEEAVKG